jgi:branched-chain amino acid transport system permease protein
MIANRRPGAATAARVLPIAGWSLLAALVILTGVDGSRYFVYLATLIALNAALATSLNLLIGYTGQFAMSHAAFYGLGAYVSALLITHLGFGFWVSVPVAMLLAGALAAVIGYPAVRFTGGIYLALITFAFGELARLVASNWQDLTGGPMGMRVLYSPSPLFGIDLGSAKGLYWLAVAMLLISLAVIVLVRRSRFGRALIAIREDEVLASFLGVNVVGYKLAAYVISSMLAAMVGTAYAPILTFISPDLLGVNQTISWIGILIVGGIGTVAGPIIGTLIFYAIPELLSVPPLYRLIALGVVIIVVVLFAPEGIAGVMRRLLRRSNRRRAAALETTGA